MPGLIDEVPCVFITMRILSKLVHWQFVRTKWTRRDTMKPKVLVPQKRDRAKVVGKVLCPDPNFVVWASGNCCFSACTRC